MGDVVYNGELRALYNDLDKRISVDAADRDSWRKAHDSAAKEHRSYVHEKFHDVLAQIAIMSAKIECRPCEQHANEMKWLRTGLYILYGMVAGLTTLVLKFHFGG